MRTPKPSALASLGTLKEQLARRYLESRGLRLLAHNYRCRQGEIDLVMATAEALVFVEVRFRRSHRFGSPAETIGPRKRQRITTAARHYLQRYPSALPCRFDVLAISGEDTIDWIQDAFRDE